MIQYHVQKKNYQVHIEQRSDVNKDEILEIIEDSEGYLWILRKNGLSRFCKDKKYFTRYVNPETGDEFRNILMIPDGSFIIGSDFGIYHFHPDDIINRKIPRVVFTDFNVMNKPFPLDSSITFKKQITLTHDQNFFSLQFAALDYQDPNKNQYAYMLEGLDKDWIDNSNRHFASYSKVQPGTYMFRVKGSNSDGYWNEKGAAIKIVILPPWWQTSWARLSYALIAGLLIFGFWRFQTNRIRMKHQLEIEKLQAEKLQEIDRVKSHFFANISHEFRTPLTLILGPLESLRARISDSRTKQELNLIQRSAQRLYVLIGQLLDLSKLESGQMKLQAERIVLGNFLRPLILSFASWAEQKKITLQYQEPENPVEIYIDTEIIEKIVTNLLSNAMKFTPEGGRVSVKTEVFSDIQESSGDPVPEDKSQKFVTISVSDSGPGIPEDSIEHIFDRFYQAGNGYLNNQDGTGIGLALTRELVDRHYGKIRVESSPEKGSTFTVELPLGISHFREKE
ncbi:MAG: hybrid sensor histidine kinase/response regulator, partial [Calditrichaeota bacterium]|nr:hybrid sensor histidine kinase/response regulator [Calditrichota bacterium]